MSSTPIPSAIAAITEIVTPMGMSSHPSEPKKIRIVITFGNRAITPIFHERKRIESITKTIASAKVLPKLKAGKLTRYGYHADLSAKKRLTALSKSVLGVGYVKTIRRVVAIRNYSEHDPKLLKIYETDIKNLESEIDKLKPDILLAGSANSRKEIYRYTERLLKSTGFPEIVIPTHWDDFRVTYDAPQEKALEAKVMPFVKDVNRVSPKTKVLIPQHLVPIIIN